MPGAPRVAGASGGIDAETAVALARRGGTPSQAPRVTRSARPRSPRQEATARPTSMLCPMCPRRAIWAVGQGDGAAAPGGRRRLLAGDLPPGLSARLGGRAPRPGRAHTPCPASKPSGREGCAARGLGGLGGGTGRSLRAKRRERDAAHRPRSRRGLGALARAPRRGRSLRWRRIARRRRGPRPARWDRTWPSHAPPSAWLPSPVGTQDGHGRDGGPGPVAVPGATPRGPAPASADDPLDAGLSDVRSEDGDARIAHSGCRGGVAAPGAATPARSGSAAPSGLPPRSRRPPGVLAASINQASVPRARGGEDAGWPWREDRIVAAACRVCPGPRPAQGAAMDRRRKRAKPRPRKAG